MSHTPEVDTALTTRRRVINITPIESVKISYYTSIPRLKFLTGQVSTMILFHSTTQASPNSCSDFAFHPAEKNIHRGSRPGLQQVSRLMEYIHKPDILGNYTTGENNY